MGCLESVEPLLYHSPIISLGLLAVQPTPISLLLVDNQEALSSDNNKASLIHHGTQRKNAMGGEHRTALRPNSIVHSRFVMRNKTPSPAYLTSELFYHLLGHRAIGELPAGQHTHMQENLLVPSNTVHPHYVD